MRKQILCKPLTILCGTQIFFSPCYNSQGPIEISMKWVGGFLR
jgi:hypothetical protein